MMENQKQSNQTNVSSLKYSKTNQTNDCKLKSQRNVDINREFKIAVELNDSECSECPICMGLVEDRALTDSCLHEFCRKCIEKWSHNHNKCPICRRVYTSIIHNIISETEYNRIPVSKPSSNSHTSLLLVDENISLLFTPLDSGIYMIHMRQTPHGVQQNILFLAPNHNFILQNMSSNVTFVRPEQLDNILSDSDQTEAVGRD